MTGYAERDEVIKFVGAALRSGDNVMNLDTVTFVAH